MNFQISFELVVANGLWSSSAGLKVRNFQLCEQPIRLLQFSFLPQS